MNAEKTNPTSITHFCHCYEINMQFIGYRHIFILTSCRVGGGANPTRRGSILFMKIEDDDKEVI